MTPDSNETNGMYTTIHNLVHKNSHHATRCVIALAILQHLWDNKEKGGFNIANNMRHKGAAMLVNKVAGKLTDKTINAAFNGII